MDAPHRPTIEVVHRTGPGAVVQDVIVDGVRWAVRSIGVEWAARESSIVTLRFAPAKLVVTGWTEREG